MPTYEYECEGCGCFELFQSMTDEPLKSCTTCGYPVRRLISGGYCVIIKGSSSRGLNVPGQHAEDWKIQRHTKEVRQIMSEPVTESEIAVADEMAKERDQEYGFEAGHSGGGRAPVLKQGESKHTPEAAKKISAAKSKWRRKIGKSRQERRKVL